MGGGGGVAPMRLALGLVFRFLKVANPIDPGPRLLAPRTLGP